MKLRFRFPEIFFGMLLAVAIFLLGAIFWSSQSPTSQPDSPIKANNASNQQKQEEGWWERARDPIAIFTFCLVAVGAVQIGFFYRQLRLIRISLDDTKQAADATTAAAAAATRQAKVAEDSLIKLERPYLFIFKVSELEVDEMDEETGLLLSVTYSVANYGKIPAIIKYAQAILAIGTDPPLPDRLPDSHSLIASPIFAASEVRHEIAARYVWIGGSEFDEYGGIIPSIPDGKTLFLWVIVTYRGPFTDQHETRVCWIYNESTGQFVGPWGGPEYSGQK